MADNNEFTIELVGKLDSDKTLENIKDDLEGKIAKKINEKSPLKLTASLNVSETQKKIQSQLKDISKNLNVDLNIGGGGVAETIKNDVKQAEQAVSGLSRTLNTGIGKTAQSTYADVLKNLGLDSKSIEKATAELSDMKVRVDSISTAFRDVGKDGSGGKILNVNIAGTDELGRSISLIQTFGKDVDSVVTHTTRITENFAKQRENARKVNDELETQQRAVAKIQRTLDNANAKYTQRQNPLIGVISTESTDDSGKQTILNTTDNAVESAKEYAEAFNNASNAIEAVNKKLRDGQTITKSELTDLENLVSEAERLGGNARAAQTTATSQRTKDVESQVKTETEALAKFEAQVKRAGISMEDVENGIGDLNKELQSVGSDSNNLANYLNMLDQAKERFQTLKTENAAAADILKNVDSVENQLKKLSSLSEQKIFKNNSDDLSVQKMNAEVADLSSRWQNLKAQFEETGLNDQLKVQFEQLSSDISNTTSNANRLKQSLKDVTDASKLQSDKDTLDNRITMWLKNNTNAGEKLKKSLMDIQAQVQSADRGRLTQLQQEFKRTTQYARETGQVGASFFDMLKDKLSKFTGWFSISNAVMSLANDFKQSVETLKEVDSILTEISKTSERTEASLKSLGSSAFETANKYGVTAQSYLTGVQEMSRAGFGEKASEQMAELAILAQAAGDMTAETAQDYLIATDAAYQLSGSEEQLRKILDGQNQITNRNAVSMTDMAEATKEAASIAAQYGVEIEELSALIAMATSKTRESGSETGNAIKSIFVSLSDTTNNEIVKAFDSVGVSMTKMVDGSEKLKTPIELLRELSEVFVTLDEGDKRRSTILNDIGGKYRANTLAAILSDFDSFDKIMKDYSEGLGSAQEEAEKSANNWEGAANRVKNATTDLVQNFVDADFMADFLNNFSKGIKMVDDFTESVGLLGTAFTALMTYKGATGSGRAKMFALIEYARISSGGNTERAA